MCIATYVSSTLIHYTTVHMKTVVTWFITFLQSLVGFLRTAGVEEVWATILAVEAEVCMTSSCLEQASFTLLQDLKCYTDTNKGTELNKYIHVPKVHFAVMHKFVN